MIPQTIWQTYKVPYEQLPEYAKQAAASWQFHNYDWQYRYMDDAEVLAFVGKEYGQAWVDIFNSCPLGVMRADMWRYMVIYKHGGMYADLDTICHKPIGEWLEPDVRMIVCPEVEDHLCQWAFAAEAGHPALKSVIDCVWRAFQTPDYTHEHFVHAMTGPGVWTEGISEALGYRAKNWIAETKAVNAMPLAQELGFRIHDDWRWFHWHACEHIYGSQKWNDGKYVQWIEERKQVLA